MITKEQIISILEEHTFKVYQHGDVVAKSDFDNIADCIVKNLNIPAVSNSLDLRELERKLDEALGKETRETLIEWLKQQRRMLN